MKKRLISVVVLVVMLCSMIASVSASTSLDMYCEKCSRVTTWWNYGYTTSDVVAGTAYCGACAANTMHAKRYHVYTYTCGCNNQRTVTEYVGRFCSKCGDFK